MEEIKPHILKHYPILTEPVPEQGTMEYESYIGTYQMALSDQIHEEETKANVQRLIAERNAQRAQRATSESSTT